jgi:phage shock protein A
MASLAQIEARVEALKIALAAAKEGLTGDVQNLKAEIEALRAQITDPATLARIDAALTQIEDSVAALGTLDQQTPPTEDPGTPGV